MSLYTNSTYLYKNYKKNTISETNLDQIKVKWTMTSTLIRFFSINTIYNLIKFLQVIILR